MDAQELLNFQEAYEEMIMNENKKNLPIEKMERKVDSLYSKFKKSLSGENPDLFSASKLTRRVGNISRVASGTHKKTNW